MPDLFSPLTVKDVSFRNRIGVSPMCQYSSENGVAGSWHLVHLGCRAVGGAALVVAEATAVSAEGRITPGCAGIWNDAQAEALAPIVRFIEAHGAVPGIQIAHAGRKGSANIPWNGGEHLPDDEGGWEIVGPCGEPFDENRQRLWKSPRALDAAGIAQVQDRFVQAAQRALDAGYKLLEIHGAHGYLLHSFFTPLVNRRTDGYGGSLENRARMMLETVEKVRKVWPERLPLAIRLSISDWSEEGLAVEDNVRMALWLKERGVDFIDCSSGGATPAQRSSMGNHTAEQPELARRIRAGADMATMAVGGIERPEHADGLVSSGAADMVMLARGLLRNPYWPHWAANQLGVPTKDLMPVQNGFFVG